MDNNESLIKAINEMKCGVRNEIEMFDQTDLLCWLKRFTIFGIITLITQRRVILNPVQSVPRG